MVARRAAALEGLDDDHATAAARAWMRERLRFIGLGGNCIAGLGLRSRPIEQFACPRDVLAAGAAGEQTVVADAVEAAWQDMDQEAASPRLPRSSARRCMAAISSGLRRSEAGCPRRQILRNLPRQKPRAGLAAALSRREDPARHAGQSERRPFGPGRGEDPAWGVTLSGLGAHSPPN